MPHKPDFFIVGAPKCGTTTLYSWLKDHPDIFMPDAKEPHYFAQELSDRYCRVRDEKSYFDLFKNKHRGQIAGEASVLHGFSKGAVEGILKFNSKAKIIFMVRHPIDMIVSYHGQLLVNLEEDVKSFEKAWNSQRKRAAGKDIPQSSQDRSLLQYGEIGHLAKHLTAIENIVPKDQLKVILLDDMATDPKKTYTKTLDFLGVPDDGKEEFSAENEASAIKYQWLEKIKRSQNVYVRGLKSFLKRFPFSNKLMRMNQSRRQNLEFDRDFLNMLYLHFEHDILFLEKYFGRSLKTKYERKS